MSLYSSSETRITHSSWLTPIGSTKLGSWSECCISRMRISNSHCLCQEPGDHSGYVLCEQIKNDFNPTKQNRFWFLSTHNCLVYLKRNLIGPDWIDSSFLLAVRPMDWQVLQVQKRNVWGTKQRETLLLVHWGKINYHQSRFELYLFNIVLKLELIEIVTMESLRGIIGDYNLVITRKKVMNDKQWRNNVHFVLPVESFQNFSFESDQCNQVHYMILIK